MKKPVVKISLGDATLGFIITLILAPIFNPITLFLFFSLLISGDFDTAFAAPLTTSIFGSIVSTPSALVGVMGVFVFKRWLWCAPKTVWLTYGLIIGLVSSSIFMSDLSSGQISIPHILIPGPPHIVILGPPCALGALIFRQVALTQEERKAVHRYNKERFLNFLKKLVS